MRAWRYKAVKHGLENSLTFETEAPLPVDPAKLPANTTLVKITAASLNPVDYKMPEVPFATSTIIKTPAVPAHDFAGTVVATTVPTLKPGQRVFGHANPPTQHGACAEYTMVAGDSNLIALPQGLSNEQGATIGVAALTAWQSIVPQLDALAGRTRGEGVKGKHVFINGGSGGTGTFGIQIAKVLGASRVTTSCSAANAELCKSLGADQVIDYRRKDIGEALAEEVAGDLDGKGYDLVVDNVGQPDHLHKASEKFLKPSGKFAQVGATPSLATAKSVAERALRPAFLGGSKRKWQFVGKKANREEYEQIASLMAEGKVTAVVDESFPFDKVPEAYVKLKTGRAKGKIVVQISDK